MSNLKLEPKSAFFRPTPLPWSNRGKLIEHWREHPETGTPQPQLIATCAERTGQTEANAELIVRAVNCHADMVETLKLALATIDRLTVQHGPFNSTEGTRSAINAALSKAESEAK